MHPIPQNIMQVEFQLFGSLTIREFTIIAAGGIFAFIAYSSSLPFILKWPLILLFTGGGIAIAKYKINDRNLEVYISSFINAMMAPQKMVWRKGRKHMKLLEEREQAVQNLSATRFVKSGIGIEDLDSVALSGRDSEYLDEHERKIDSLIQGMYEHNIPKSQIDTSTGQTQSDSSSSLSVQKTTKVKEKEAESKGEAVVEEVPIIKIKEKEAESKGEAVVEEVPSVSVDKEVQHYDSELANKGQLFDSLLGVSDEEVSQKIRKQQVELEKSYESKAKEEEKKKKDEKVVDVKGLKEKASHGHAFEKTTPPTYKQEKPVTKPNIITGFVKDSNEKLLDGAVIIIKDSETDRTVRSMITNPLGHFSHTSSLKNGEYTINLYKDGHNFKPVKVKIDGTVMEPINIIE